MGSTQDAAEHEFAFTQVTLFAFTHVTPATNVNAKTNVNANSPVWKARKRRRASFVTFQSNVWYSVLIGSHRFPEFDGWFARLSAELEAEGTRHATLASNAAVRRWWVTSSILLSRCAIMYCRDL